MSAPLRTAPTRRASIARRMASGAGAYGYAQAVSIGTQLVALPVFLHHWDMPPTATGWP
ncbi:hypothetical protein ACFJI0_21790 [Hydrogenophaga sp. UC242_53]|uniref:hypothetical protein n=1 Tax=Hydrogenophaga sp. UC242_53 TaxID=3350170 RepID=UPI0036D2EF77